MKVRTVCVVCLAQTPVLFCAHSLSPAVNDNSKNGKLLQSVQFPSDDCSATNVHLAIAAHSCGIISGRNRLMKAVAWKREWLMNAVRECADDWWIVVLTARDKVVFLASDFRLTRALTENCLKIRWVLCVTRILGSTPKATFCTYKYDSIWMWFHLLTYF